MLSGSHSVNIHNLKLGLFLIGLKDYFLNVIFFTWKVHNENIKYDTYQNNADKIRNLGPGIENYGNKKKGKRKKIEII